MTMIRCTEIDPNDTREAVRWHSVSGESSMAMNGPVGEALHSYVKRCGEFHKAVMMAGSVEVTE